MVYLKIPENGIIALDLNRALGDDELKEGTKK
jgi:hypothetical protein